MLDMPARGDSAVDEPVKQRIIEMYRQGKKAREITEETGVGRSTIYYILSQQGVRTNRRSGPRPELPELGDDEYQSLVQRLIDRVAELERECGELRGRLSQYE